MLVHRLLICSLYCRRAKAVNVGKALTSSPRDWSWHQGHISLSEADPAITTVTDHFPGHRKVAMLKIYHMPHARGSRVVWTAEELGLPHEVVIKGRGRLKLPDFLAVNRWAVRRPSRAAM